MLLNAEGSLPAAMAEGVEESDIILMLISQKYQESRNCQKGSF